MGIPKRQTDQLTILTWLWQQPGGRAQYTSEHVNVWADMVRRHLTLPHTVACVTDEPAGIDPSIRIITPPHEFEDVRIPTWSGGRPQCLRRISMFRPDAASIFGARFVSMDMDCVISDSLDPLFNRKEDIVLYATPPSPVANPRPYNGSMLMMTAGVRPAVYDQFSEAGAVAAGERYIGSDQAWISHVLGPHEATWGERDGVVWWGRWREGVMGRVLFFPGVPKPWEMLDSDPWVRAHYHRNHGGRCLVLGYAPSVWEDAAAAAAGGNFDAVIASPEAAAHLKTKILAIAESDLHADRLVKMLGFDEVVFCGRTDREAV